jgi:hypothetical protein
VGTVAVAAVVEISSDIKISHRTLSEMRQNEDDYRRNSRLCMHERTKEVVTRTED